MMKTGTRQILAVSTSAIALLISGCATNVKVNEIDSSAQPNTVVNGIPFRIKDRYRISLYRLVDGKYQKLETKENTAALANMDHVYVLKLSGSALADGNLNFNINSDNTLAKIKIDSTSKAPEFISSVGKAQKSLADADIAAAKTGAADKAAQDATVSAKEDARLAAFDAEQAAVLAAVELDALSPTASSLDRTKAEQKVARARVLANQKARRAEIALPFPDAGT